MKDYFEYIVKFGKNQKISNGKRHRRQVKIKKCLSRVLKRGEKQQFKIQLEKDLEDEKE